MAATRLYAVFFRGWNSLRSQRLRVEKIASGDSELEMGPILSCLLAGGAPEPMTLARSANRGARLRFEAQL